MLIAEERTPNYKGIPSKNAKNFQKWNTSLLGEYSRTKTTILVMEHDQERQKLIQEPIEISTSTMMKFGTRNSRREWMKSCVFGKCI